MIKVKSIYDKPAPEDGERIYIDSLWADNRETRSANISEWRRDIAPSYYTWRYNFSIENWDEYVEAYRDELQQPQKQAALQELKNEANNGDITLVYGTKDPLHNNAVILKKVLDEMS